MVEEKQSGRGREGALPLPLGANDTFTPELGEGRAVEGKCLCVDICMCNRADDPHVPQGS